MLSSISVLIPAYKDEKTIGYVVDEADKIARKTAPKYEILVINDASPDNLGEVLEGLKRKYKNLSVTTHTENKGYGQTIKELYYQAKYDWFFTVPGDNQIPPAELEKLVKHAEKADMILGWRVNRRDSEGRLFQSSVYNNLLRFLFGIALHGGYQIRYQIHSTLVNVFDLGPLRVDRLLLGDKVIVGSVGHESENDRCDHDDSETAK